MRHCDDHALSECIFFLSSFLMYLPNQANKHFSFHVDVFILMSSLDFIFVAQNFWSSNLSKKTYEVKFATLKKLSDEAVTIIFGILFV